MLWDSDDDLQKIFAALKRQNIALALEVGLVTATDRCGRNVEGYGGERTIQLAERIARLGGELAYIAMDEPAWYGHVFNGTNACRSSLADIAGDVTRNVTAIRAVFPKVQIGDIEPVGPSPNETLIHEYGEWINTYRQAAGEPLAFFHADVQWEKPWLASVTQMAGELKEKAIPFGIIYNGNGDAPTDAAWVAQAEAHYLAYEADDRIAPDQAVFQSWVSHPSRLFPDTDPGAFTYLIRRYFRPRTRIVTEVAHDTISGRLVDGIGKPVPSAGIVISGTSDAGPGFPSQASSGGSVPAGASRAVLGLRIGTECECAGSADIDVGTIRYREAGGTATQHNFTPGRDGWRDGATATTSASPHPMSYHVTTLLNQPTLLNSPSFAVTPGADFALDLQWRVSPSSVGSGYLALIFLDADGKEIRRSKLPLEPGSLSLGTVMTDRDGHFVLSSSRITTAIDRVQLAYPGDDRLRATIAILSYPQP